MYTNQGRPVIGYGATRNQVPIGKWSSASDGVRVANGPIVDIMPLHEAGNSVLGVESPFLSFWGKYLCNRT